MKKITLFIIWMCNVQHVGVLDDWTTRVELYKYNTVATYTAVQQNSTPSRAIAKI